MGETQEYLNVVWRKKWWIIAFCVVTVAIAIVLTLPKFSPTLYGVHQYLETYPNIPSKTMHETMVLGKKYLETPECKRLVVSKFGENVDKNTLLNEKNYSERIKVIIRKNDLLLYVKHENAQKACEIADFLVEFYNMKFEQYFVPYFEELKSQKEKILYLSHARIDSLQKERINATDSILEYELKTAIDIYNSHSNDLCEIIALLDSDKTFTAVTIKADPENAVVHPYRCGILFATFILSLFISTLFFVAVEMIKKIFE